MPEADPLHDDLEEITRLEEKISALEADLRQKKEIILAQHTKLEAFFETSIDAVVQMDFDGYITGWNQQAEKIFGWKADQILEQKLEHTIIPERYREAHRRGLQHYLDSGESTVMNTLIEIHAQHRDGHEFPVELSIAVIDSPDLQEFSAYIRDISDRKQAESIIWRQANFDSLTELPNRNLFLERLEQAALNCDRSGLSLGLLYIDLDRFKQVNDSMGHDMGDALLVEFARRLRQVVREVDTVARLSGDEFTIILGNIDDQISVQRVCQKINEVVAEPFQLGSESVQISASIGVSFYPEDAAEIEALQRNADQAMYEAKGNGRNRYQFFTPELQERAQRKRKLVNDLRDAVRQEQFEVYYQPIIDLNDDSLTRVEALLRWEHAESGLISPAVFIPIAEESRLVNEIGDWAFYQVCAQIREWQRIFGSDFQVSINTSLLQWIDSSAMMHRWFEHLREQGISGETITVEIKEGLLTNADDRVTNRLLDFRDAGIRIAVDDFGTGHSSLPDLKQYGVDYLKIDQSYVRNLDHDENDRALCEAIIAMAHKLDIRVIAEGVEKKSQARALKSFGCDYGQGFLFSHPLSAIDLTALIASKT